MLAVGLSSNVCVSRFVLIMFSRQNFIKSFAPFVKPLASAVQFEPHYFIYDGTYWDCTRKVGAGYRCGTQCTNQGRYCAPDPDRHLHQGLSGYDTIRENLRQICIWKQVAPAYSSTFGLPWWNYVTLFNQNCPGSQFNNDTCSEVQQVAAGTCAASPHAGRLSHMRVCVASRCRSRSHKSVHGTEWRPGRRWRQHYPEARAARTPELGDHAAAHHHRERRD